MASAKGFVRKATVEIQRRPQRQGTTTQLKPGVGMQKTRSFVDPKAIPSLLKECYAPEEFDEASTILLCNFPTGLSSSVARNFASWYGPVVRVERAPALGGESNFIIVFASPEFAKEIVKRGELLYEDGKTSLYCRAVDSRQTLWSKLTNFWGGTPTAA